MVGCLNGLMDDSVGKFVDSLKDEEGEGITTEKFFHAAVERVHLGGYELGGYNERNGVEYHREFFEPDEINTSGF